MAKCERCLQNEPGTLQFEGLRPSDEQNKLLFYEVYSDEAAFNTHGDGPFVARVRAETKDMIIELVGKRCAVET